MSRMAYVDCWPSMPSSPAPEPWDEACATVARHAGRSRAAVGRRKRITIRRRVRGDCSCPHQDERARSNQRPPAHHPLRPSPRGRRRSRYVRGASARARPRPRDPGCVRRHDRARAGGAERCYRRARRDTARVVVGCRRCGSCAAFVCVPRPASPSISAASRRATRWTGPWRPCAARERPLESSTPAATCAFSGRTHGPPSAYAIPPIRQRQRRSSTCATPPVATSADYFRTEVAALVDPRRHQLRIFGHQHHRRRRDVRPRRRLDQGRRAGSGAIGAAPCAARRARFPASSPAEGIWRSRRPVRHRRRICDFTARVRCRLP